VQKEEALRKLESDFASYKDKYSHSDKEVRIIVSNYNSSL